MTITYTNYRTPPFLPEMKMGEAVGGAGETTYVISTGLRQIYTAFMTNTTTEAQGLVSKNGYASGYLIVSAFTGNDNIQWLAIGRP